MAPELLGRTLARRLADGTRLAGRVVEVEAYEPGDPASHGSRRRTAFNDRMFVPPGRLFVYFTYGNHWMMNAVTGPADVASAVLFRAVEPLEGIEEMARRRGRSKPLDLCSGPGKLCQALGVDRGDDGADLVRGSSVWIEHGAPVPADDVVRGIRVGVSVGYDVPWRFSVRDDPFVSRGRPGPPSRPRKRVAAPP